MSIKFFLCFVLFFFPKNILATKSAEKKVSFHNDSIAENYQQKIFFSLVKAKLYINLKSYDDFQAFRRSYQRKDSETLKEHLTLLDISQNMIQQYQARSLGDQHQLDHLVQLKIDQMENTLEKLQIILQNYKKTLVDILMKETVNENLHSEQIAADTIVSIFNDLETFFIDTYSNTHPQTILQALEENLYFIRFNLLYKDLLSVIKTNTPGKKTALTRFEEENIEINLKEHLETYSSYDDKYKVFFSFVSLLRKYFENKEKGSKNIQKIIKKFPYLAKGLLLKKGGDDIFNIIHELKKKPYKEPHQDIDNAIDLLTKYNKIFVDEINYLNHPGSTLMLHEELLKNIPRPRFYEGTSSDLFVIGLKMLRSGVDSNGFLDLWKKFWDNIEKYHNHKLSAEKLLKKASSEIQDNFITLEIFNSLSAKDLLEKIIQSTYSPYMDIILVNEMIEKYNKIFSNDIRKMCLPNFKKNNRAYTFDFFKEICLDEFSCKYYKHSLHASRKKEIIKKIIKTFYCYQNTPCAMEHRFDFINNIKKYRSAQEEAFSVLTKNHCQKIPGCLQKFTVFFEPNPIVLLDYQYERDKNFPYEGILIFIHNLILKNIVFCAENPLIFAAIGLNLGEDLKIENAFLEEFLDNCHPDVITSNPTDDVNLRVNNVLKNVLLMHQNIANKYDHIKRFLSTIHEYQEVQNKTLNELKKTSNNFFKTYKNDKIRLSILDILEDYFNTTSEMQENEIEQMNVLKFIKIKTDDIKAKTHVVKIYEKNKLKDFFVLFLGCSGGCSGSLESSQ